MRSFAGLVPGQVFARDFRVVAPLKEGGMGSVYVAEQISTGERRALKLMHVNLLADPRQRQRFEQEARIGSLIKSDHVVKVIGAGVDDATGQPYLAMELLEGTELEALVDRRGRIDSGELSIIFSQLCHALASAHASGIVHRDLKPENIFIATSQRADVPFTVKILDFGIAKVLAEFSQASATQTVGTPTFMAPEQTNPRAAITPAADVWALGLIAFHALTGKNFWPSANEDHISIQSVMVDVMVNAIPPASVRAGELGVAAFLPAGFDGWFAWCVNRAPTQRFPNAGEAWRALAPILGTRSSLGTPIPAATIPGTPPGMHLPSGLHGEIPPTVRPSEFGGYPGATQVGGAQWGAYPPGGQVSTLQPSAVTNPGMPRSGGIAPLPMSAPRKKSSGVLAAVLGGGVVLAGLGIGAYVFLGDTSKKATHHDDDDDDDRRKPEPASRAHVPSAEPSIGRPKEKLIPPGKLGCAPEAELVYVLSRTNEIHSFDPANKRFTFVAKTDCANDNPNSMAIDRNLVAWINFVGEVDTFDLKTKKGCTRVMSLPEGFTRIGLGFSSNGESSPTETLIVDSQAGGGLAKIDPVTKELTPIAPFSDDPNLAAQSAELAGTGAGKLYGLFQTTPFRLAEIDKVTGKILSDKQIGQALAVTAWAYSFWHGDFYVYYELNNAGKSTVMRYRPTDGSTETFTEAPFAIVGANVSTCASVPTPPDP